MRHLTIPPHWRRTASHVLVAVTLVASAASAGATSPIVRQAGGELGDLVIAGHIAYVAQGPAISVWQLDPTGATPPVWLASTTPLPGLVQGLVVDGPWLFATWRSTAPSGALAIYSLADPLAPAHQLDFAYSQGSYLSPGGLALSGSQLILADAEVGLHSIDVSNPLAPQVTSSLPGSYGLRRLRLVGNNLVGWGRSFLGSLFLETFDLSSPGQPTSVGFYSAGNYFDVGITGNLAVLVGDGLEVVDLSNLASPEWQATVEGVVGRSALADGRYAYVGDELGIHVWDLDDPSQPNELTVVAAPADRSSLAALHAAAGGTEAFVLTETGRGLLLGLAVPASPNVAHVVDLPIGIDPVAVTAAGGRLHFADFYSGLRITDPLLADVGRLDLGVPQGAYEDVAVAGTVGYVASWGYGLLTIDVSDPSAPASIGGFPYDFASAVDVNGTTAYLVRSTNGGELAVLDVSNPAAPSLLGTAPLSKGLDVLYHSGLALVADDSAFDTGGLRIHDVSNPAAPVLIGHYSQCDSAGGLDVRGTVAALACHDGSLHLVGITNPAQPVQLGVWSDPSRFLTGHRVRFDGPRVWFGHSEGVEFIDAANPNAPRRVSSASLAFPVRGLELAPTGAWAATGPGGLYELDLVVFEDGFETGNTSAWSASAP